MMAPRSAARMTFGVTAEMSTRPRVMVFATAVPTVKSATKLKNAAHTTAGNGLSTRVPTIVAIEFAESWKPLMKSKRKATATMKTMKPTTRAGLEVLEGDAAHRVRDVLALVEGALQRVVDLLPLDDVERVHPA